MTGGVKLKGKHKRGGRGSVEEEQQTFERANMADEKEVCSAQLTIKKHQLVTTKK